MVSQRRIYIEPNYGEKGRIMGGTATRMKFFTHMPTTDRSNIQHHGMDRMLKNPIDTRTFH